LEVRLTFYTNPEELLDDRGLFFEVLGIQGDSDQTKSLRVLKSRVLKLGGKAKDFNDILKSYRSEHFKECKANSDNHVIELGPITKFIGQQIALHTGKWITDEEGIWVFSAERNRDVRICSQPLTIEKIMVNRQTGNKKAVVAFRDDDDSWKRITVPKRILANNFTILELADKGLDVSMSTSKDLISYIRDLTILNKDLIPIRQSTDSLGWEDNSFSSFTPYFGNDEFDGEYCYKTLFESVNEKGNYDVWCAEMKELRKNPAVRLVTSASIASALLEPLGAQSYIVHLWGPSEFGKSVAIHAAASFWGDPAMGRLVLSMNNTMTHFMHMASVLNNIPFFGDELQTIKQNDPKASYDIFIMIMTEGVEKGRAKKDGGVEVTNTWHNVFLTNGEDPITQENSGGGAKNRVIEIGVFGDKIIKDGAATMAIITQNYGFMGSIITKVISEKLHELKARHKSLLKICQNLSTSKQSAAMATIIVADELLSPYFGEDPLDESVWLEFLKDREEVDVSERAYAWTISHISASINQFADSTKSNALHGETLGKITKVNNDFVCRYNYSKLDETLKAAGFSLKAVLPNWASKGYILPYICPDGKRKYGRHEKIGGVSVRCVWIKIPQN
ncbi:MAG: DUF927 domain-containing protein, partial [Clostridiales bacterium]|jgi:hypothetical protein|nr:DUF927 domain-containing protein [Clostridiales bacterium]